MKTAGSDRTVLGKARRGFTLIEIMMVVALIGLFVASLVPILFNSRKEGLRKACSDIVDVCNTARAKAILDGNMVELQANPPGRSLSIGGSSASWGEDIAMEMLDVNLTEWKDTEGVRVRFYPNGTSDEMTIILRSEKNEYRKISLEPMTALASAEPLIR